VSTQDTPAAPAAPEEPLESRVDRALRMEIPDPAAARNEEPAPAARPARAGMGFGGVLVMSVLAAVGGAGLALYAPAVPGLSAVLPAPAGGVSDQSLEATRSALTERLNGLDQRITMLEQAAAKTTQAPPATPAEPEQAATAEPKLAMPPTAAAPAAPALAPAAPPAVAAVPPAPQVARIDFDALVARVAGIETRLTALDPTGSAGAIIAALQTDVVALKAQVEALRVAAAQAAAGPSPAAAFAVLSVAQAAARSAPFTGEYQALAAALPNAPEVTALAPFARTGAPTPQQLSEDWTAVEANVLTAMREAAASEGDWLSRIGAMLSGLVQVRATGAPTGNGADAIAARVRLRLDRDDLAGAVTEVARLTGAPAAAAADWRRQAEARLALDARIAALRGAIDRPRAPAPVAPVPAPVATAPTPAPVPAPALAPTPAPALRETTP
jgi:hypothetical protein